MRAVSAACCACLKTISETPAAIRTPKRRRIVPPRLRDIAASDVSLDQAGNEARGPLPVLRVVGQVGREDALLEQRPAVLQEQEEREERQRYGRERRQHDAALRDRLRGVER